MGNPSALRSFPYQARARSLSSILPQVHRLVKWGGICDLTGRGFFIDRSFSAYLLLGRLFIVSFINYLA
jgi:hypothetical protein